VGCGDPRSCTDLDHLQQCSVCDPAKKYFSHPSFSYFFPNSPIKLGLQIGERILVTTHLNQSNYLATTTTRLPSLKLLVHHSTAQKLQMISAASLDVSVKLGVKNAE
jgi:hypothetical protein